METLSQRGANRLLILPVYQEPDASSAALWRGKPGEAQPIDGDGETAWVGALADFGGDNDRIVIQREGEVLAVADEVCRDGDTKFA